MGGKINRKSWDRHWMALGTGSQGAEKEANHVFFLENIETLITNNLWLHWNPWQNVSQTICEMIVCQTGFACSLKVKNKDLQIKQTGWRPSPPPDRKSQIWKCILSSKWQMGGKWKFLYLQIYFKETKQHIQLFQLELIKSSNSSTTKVVNVDGNDSMYWPFLLHAANLQIFSCY